MLLMHPVEPSQGQTGYLTCLGTNVLLAGYMVQRGLATICIHEKGQISLG